METMQKVREYDFDIHRVERAFSLFEKRINESGMLPENKALALDFKRTVYASGLMGKRRIMKYEVLFRSLDSSTKKPFNTLTRDEILDYVAKTRDSKEWALATRSDIIKMLRRYYKIKAGMENETGYPDIVKGIRAPTVQYPPINFEECPMWEDIEKMAAKASQIRDRALIKVNWEAGVRAGELLTATVGSIEHVDKGVYLNIRVSKTELRSIFLILSEPALMEWLSVHPLGDDDDAPLFCKMEKGEVNRAISHRYLYKLYDRLGKAANINKKVNPHMLRHGSASYHSDYLADSDMDAKFGWNNPKTKNRYVHKNRKAIETKILGMAGFDTSEEDENIFKKGMMSRKKCLRCGASNDSDSIVCCGCLKKFDMTVNEMEYQLKKDVNSLTMAYFENNPEALKGLSDFIAEQQKQQVT